MLLLQIPSNLFKTNIYWANAANPPVFVMWVRIFEKFIFKKKGSATAICSATKALNYVTKTALSWQLIWNYWILYQYLNFSWKSLCID